MYMGNKWILGLMGLVLSMNVLAAPVVLSGIKLEDTIVLHNTKLQLNGAGTRYRAIFKVYDMGLYTMKKIEAMAFEESMAFTESQIALFTLTEDAKEGQAAFQDKRQPQWKGQ